MPGVIDRFVEAVNPVAGIRRAAARTALKVLNSGYSHSGASRMKKSMAGWMWRGGSADDDIGANVDVLRQRSRDLYMGSPIGAAAIKTIRTNVIGSGLKLKSTPDFNLLGISADESNAWARQAEREFSLWAESTDCDAGGQFTFGELQNIVSLSALMSGDAFAVLPLSPREGSIYDLRVRLIEADRVCNPGVIAPTQPMLQILRLPNGGYIVNGVEVSRDGEIVAYHIARWHPLAQYLIPHGFAQWDRVAVRGQATGRRNILHIWEGERPDQKRGVPLLAPVIEEIKQYARYTQAELDAAVASSFIAAVIESETPQNPLGESIPEDTQVDRSDVSSLEMGPAAVIGLAQGEKVTPFNPLRPNTGFDLFTESMARQIGAAVELPAEMLLKSFKASYSASRAALLEAWKMVKTRRHRDAMQFCQPCYEELMTESVLLGRTKAPGFFDDPLIRKAWLESEWHGPAQGVIQSVQEAQAAVIRIQEGFSTRSRESAEMTGTDFESNVEQRAIEERKMKAAGLIETAVLPAQVTE